MANVVYVPRVIKVNHGPDATWVINDAFDLRWSSVNKTTAVTADLGAIGSLAGTMQKSRWQASGNYVSIAQGSSSTFHSIAKRTGDATSLTKLTSGVPTWSNNRMNSCWPDDNTLVVVGEVATRVEICTRSGDVFSNVASPLDVQPGGNCYGVDCTPDGQTLIVSYTYDGSKNLTTYTRSGNQFNVANNYTVGTGSNNGLAIAISPDGTKCAAFCNGTTPAVLRTFSISGSALTQTNANLISSGTGGSRADLKYSPSGKFLFFGTDSGGTTTNMQTWNVETGYTACTLGVTAISVRSLGYSPTGKFIITGDTSASTVIWEQDSSTGSLTLKTVLTAGGTGAGFSVNEFQP